MPANWMQVSQRSSLFLGVSSAKVLSAWFQVTVELTRVYTSVDCTTAAEARMAAAKKKIYHNNIQQRAGLVRREDVCFAWAGKAMYASGATPPRGGLTFDMMDAVARNGNEASGHDEQRGVHVHHRKRDVELGLEIGDL